MSMEDCLWLGGLIAAHSQRRIYGRTRLQKEVKLLQRLGFPTDYPYTIHFYGPYSEALQADIGLLEAMNLVQETTEYAVDGNPFYVLEAKPQADRSEVENFRGEIDRLQGAETVVLELAATYDAFRESGSDHDEALSRLRRKKGAKCDDGNQEKALSLLDNLGLETS